MVTVKLLSWQNLLRHLWREQIILISGFIVLMLLIVALLSREQLLLKRKQLLLQISALRSSLSLETQRHQALDKELLLQDRRLHELQLQQHRREQFSCHWLWLRELGVKLSNGVIIEKISTQGKIVQLVAKISVRSLLDKLLESLSTVTMLHQMKVRQLNNSSGKNFIIVEIEMELICHQQKAF